MDGLAPVAVSKELVPVGQCVCVQVLVHYKYLFILVGFCPKFYDAMESCTFL